MATAGGFRINTPLVAVQEIEGEAILINFDTGCYYSASATGALLLELVQRGELAGRMAAKLAERCGVPESELAGAVAAFFKEALDGGLLVPSDSVAMADPPLGAAVPALAYVPPRLERFDDLQDLLMLDPIHDVDQVGWPMQAPDTGTTPPAPPA